MREAQGPQGSPRSRWPSGLSSVAHGQSLLGHCGTRRLAGAGHCLSAGLTAVQTGGPAAGALCVRALRLLFPSPALVPVSVRKRPGRSSRLWLTVFCILSLVTLAWIFLGGMFRLTYPPSGKTSSVLGKHSLFEMRVTPSEFSSQKQALSSMRFLTLTVSMQMGSRNLVQTV